MDAAKIYAILQDACRALKQEGDHVIAAYVAQAMALVERRYAVGRDHLAVDDD